MSKFDLRDISERLTNSPDTEAVVYEFLGALQSARSDWRAALAFYEVSADALVNVYERNVNQLVRREIVVPVDKLPPRLVRKFFHANAFFNHSDRRALFSNGPGNSPHYVADPMEAWDLLPLTPLSEWRSCICMPLADQQDMIALLLLVSEKKNAFPGRAIGEIVPIKSLAAMTLAQRLYRGTATPAPEAAEPQAEPVVDEFQERIQRMAAQALALEEDNQDKSNRILALADEIELLDQDSSTYKDELERVKESLEELEQRSVTAVEHLNEAFSELNAAHWRTSDLERTVEMMREFLAFVAATGERASFVTDAMDWVCDRFDIERCSLMTPDANGESLRVAAYCGLDETLAARVRVRVGQGIAGWVAHNRKPLFVRVKDSSEATRSEREGTYNSDSFIVVPLVHQGRLHGVLNLSNKRDGDAFDESDLDRALLVASTFALALSSRDLERRAAAWT